MSTLRFSLIPPWESTRIGTRSAGKLGIDELTRDCRFGDFLGTIAGFARGLPVVGTWIGRGMDAIGAGRRNEDLPV